MLKLILFFLFQIIVGSQKNPSEILKTDPDVILKKKKKWVKNLYHIGVFFFELYLDLVM